MYHPLPTSPSNGWARIPFLGAPSLQGGQGLQTQVPGNFPGPLFPPLPSPPLAPITAHFSLRVLGSPLLGQFCPVPCPALQRPPPTPQQGSSLNKNVSFGDSKSAFARTEHTQIWAPQTGSTQGRYSSGEGDAGWWGDLHHWCLWDLRKNTEIPGAQSLLPHLPLLPHLSCLLWFKGLYPCKTQLGCTSAGSLPLRSPIA